MREMRVQVSDGRSARHPVGEGSGQQELLHIDLAGPRPERRAGANGLARGLENGAHQAGRPASGRTANRWQEHRQVVGQPVPQRNPGDRRGRRQILRGGAYVTRDGPGELFVAPLHHEQSQWQPGALDAKDLAGNEHLRGARIAFQHVPDRGVALLTHTSS